MSQDTVYKTKKMSQKDLEKHFGVKLTTEEFNVVKDFAFNDHEEVVGDDKKFYQHTFIFLIFQKKLFFQINKIELLISNQSII